MLTQLDAQRDLIGDLRLLIEWDVQRAQTRRDTDGDDSELLRVTSMLRRLAQIDLMRLEMEAIWCCGPRSEPPPDSPLLILGDTDEQKVGQ